MPCISHLAEAILVDVWSWDGCLALAGACCLQHKLIGPYPRGQKSLLALNKVWLGLGFRVGALPCSWGFLSVAASGVAISGMEDAVQPP